MSDESVTRKPLWFLIVIISTQVILIFSLLSQERVLDSYTQELELMKTVYGSQATEDIYDKSVHYATAFYIDNGVLEQLKTHLLPKAYRENTMVDDPLMPLWNGVNNVIDNVFISFSYMLSRLFSLAHWFPMAIILCIASLSSALQLREIKKESFQYSSPFRYGIGVKFLYLSPVVIYLMLFSPVIIHPAVFVLFIVLVSFSFFLVISNTIKRL